ncbi:hypothetical protein DSL72_002529 [Monilinia vaccinii-corymbosi]|uniref:Rhodopsin domain-containing protein n=1 Tax=Monilinia vaccinii-corymbosi TaxID=61207 RepID=A0A8A3PCX6_9HELO|nr:hypothetical protein DSL72_002529 [Monilinia vaccinii-corymbosi]
MARVWWLTDPSSSVCAFSVTRMLSYFHVGGEFLARYNDETYYTSPVFSWVNIELSSAILCVSLPTYRPIWRSLSQRTLPTMAPHKLPEYPSQKGSDRSAHGKWGPSGRHESQRFAGDAGSVRELNFGRAADVVKYAVATHIDGGSDGSDMRGEVPREGICVEHEVRIEEKY